MFCLGPSYYKNIFWVWIDQKDDKDMTLQNPITEQTTHF